MAIVQAHYWIGLICKSCASTSRLRSCPCPKLHWAAEWNRVHFVRQPPSRHDFFFFVSVAIPIAAWMHSVSGFESQYHPHRVSVGEIEPHLSILDPALAQTADALDIFWPVSSCSTDCWPVATKEKWLPSAACTSSFRPCLCFFLPAVPVAPERFCFYYAHTDRRSCLAIARTHVQWRAWPAFCLAAVACVRLQSAQTKSRTERCKRKHHQH